MSINKNFINSLKVFTLMFCFSLPAISQAQNSATDDAKITLEVKTKLMTDKEIPLGRVSVKTNDGTVFLKGNLVTEKQASSAIEIAESVEGVKNVNAEHLTVTGSKQPLTDSYITAKIKGLFLREKLFGDKDIGAVTDINVETKNGIVYLSGRANNANQAKTAENLAKEIEGVKEVKSTIKVE